MRLVVFGSSGRIGQRCVALALEQGYDVTVFVHTHNPFVKNTRLRIVTGDITNTSNVREALIGSQVVLSTLGSWGTKDKNILSAAMEVIIPAMQQLEIRRIITLSGAGAYFEQDHNSVFDRLSHRMLQVVAPRILADSERHLVLLSTSGLDWTCLRSPIMTKIGRTGYHLDTVMVLPWATITRTAVAQAMLTQVSDQTWIHQAPIIHRA